MVSQYKSGTSNAESRFVLHTSVDEPVNAQLTPKGHQIPIPVRSQIMRDFEKIASSVAGKSGDSEDDDEEGGADGT